jgi:hypothetical protein
MLDGSRRDSSSRPGKNEPEAWKTKPFFILSGRAIGSYLAPTRQSFMAPS